MAGPVRAGPEVRALRVGVYDLYWATYGGGEQVDGTIAQVLAEAGHDVTLLGPRPPDVERTQERLGVDLSRCDHRAVHDDDSASAASADFDVFVNGTYLSRAVNHADLGYYYVHFPQVPSRRVDRIRNRAYIGAVKGLGSMSKRELPLRLREAQAGFDRRIARTHFIPSYRRFLANSTFTAEWVERLWGVVATCCTHRSERRCNLGRSAARAEPRPVLRPHSRTQQEAARPPRCVCRDGTSGPPRLGARTGRRRRPADREYTLACKRAAVGHRVQVHINAPGALVEELLGEASIYWHAAGFGEDPRRHPDRFEHFGIALVEAMAAGAAPVVYGAAGPAEIVRDGVDGDHWRARSELISITTA